MHSFSHQDALLPKRTVSLKRDSQKHNVLLQSTLGRSGRRNSKRISRGESLGPAVMEVETLLVSNRLQSASITVPMDLSPQHTESVSWIGTHVSAARSVEALHAVLCTAEGAGSLNRQHVATFLLTMAKQPWDQDAQHVQQVLKRLDDITAAQLHSFTPAETAVLLDAWALLQVSHPGQVALPPYIPSLLEQVMLHLTRLTATQLVTAAGAICRLGVPLPPSQLVALLSALQCRMAELTADDHVRLASALAASHCGVPQLWAYEWRLRTANLPLSPVQAAAMIQAASELSMFERGSAPEWVLGMVTRLCGGGLFALPPSAFVSTLGAVASLAAPGSLPEGWEEEWMSAASQLLLSRGRCAATSPDDLAAMAAAFGTLGARASEHWRSKLFRVLGYKLPSFNAGQLAQLMWGLAMMGSHPDEELMVQLRQEIETHANEFERSQLVQIEWAMQVFSQK